MVTKLYCASCGRSNEIGMDGVKPFKFQGGEWCTFCADIQELPEGITYVATPSPGRMYESTKDDPLSAWEDCYSKKPKKRILVKVAKEEIHRAWEIWEGDKSSDLSMFKFFGWLSKYRPYFLTFRGTGSNWQTVHCWLIQYEEEKRAERDND